MEQQRTPEELYHEVRLFAAMLKDCCRLGMWCLDPDGSLLDTTCPENKEYLMFLKLGKCLEPVFEDIERNARPVLLEDVIGMLWCVDFLRREDDPEKTSCLIVLGPVFDAASSLSALEESIHALNLSVNLTVLIREKLEQVPVLSLNNLTQFILMQHRILTGETITSGDIDYRRQNRPESRDDGDDLAFNPERALATEERILQLIREGSPNFGALAAPLIENSPQERVLLSDGMRQRKDTLILFTALAARAATEGGVTARTVYTLRTRYIQAIEACRTYTELVQLNWNMVDDFIRQVQRAHEQQNASRVVRACCEYIHMHVDRPFSLQEMARTLGYADYYLSKKFATETGERISAYLTRARLERARVMLASTDASVRDISEALQFHSRNYFTKKFKEAYGIAPNAYRDQYGVKTNDQKAEP